MDLSDLLDLMVDSTNITIWDCDKCKNIEEDIPLDDAKEWAETHDCNVCSIEPTNSRTITINVDSVEEH